MIPQPDLAEQRALVASLASSRFRRFRQVYGGADREAVALYLLDAQIVSHFHATVRAVEVTLREGIHAALVNLHGEGWFRPGVLNLDKRTRERIDEAVQEVTPRSRPGRRAPSPQPGKVVAQLMLGTWVGLLDAGGYRPDGTRADYEADLWEPALRTAFGGGVTAPSRSDVHTLAKRVNWARNRVNHCETVVFGFPQPGQAGRGSAQVRRCPALLLEDARTLVTYMNPSVGGWIARWNELDSLIADPRAQDALAYAANMPGVWLER